MGTVIRVAVDVEVPDGVGNASDYAARAVTGGMAESFGVRVVAINAEPSPATDQQLIDRYKDERVWGVVTTWAVDVFYGERTYAEAQAFAAEEGVKEGQHVLVVLVVGEMHGPPMPPAKPRRKP